MASSTVKKDLVIVHRNLTLSAKCSNIVTEPISELWRGILRRNFSNFRRVLALVTLSASKSTSLEGGESEWKERDADTYAHMCSNTTFQRDIFRDL
jgi:hypothetical protein